MKRKNLFFFPCILILATLFSCNNSQRDFYFEGEYPPVKIITITENGESYDIEAVEGHILMYFADNVSYSEAKRLIKRHGGKIIEQMPKFDYYLVEVSAGTENNFFAQMRQESSVKYVFLNSAQCFNSVVIIDDFNEYSSSMGTTHGDGVRNVFNDNSSQNNSIQDIDVYIKDNMSFNNRLCAKLTNAVTQNDKEKITLVNISLGPYIRHKTQINGKDSIIRAKYYDAKVTEKERNTYEKDYLESLQFYASCFDKIGKEKTNFLVTNSSGNEGMWFMENILNKLDTETSNTLQNYMILVNAFDDKDRLYSNRATEKQALITTIDITEVKWRGTSFAAPKLLGYIDKIHYNVCSDLTAQEILQAVRNATPNNPRTPMSYEKLKSEAKKLCGQNKFLITPTSVGLIKKGMSVDEIRNLLGNNNIKQGYYYDFEFSYVCYELQEDNNRLLALIPTSDYVCGNYLQAMSPKDNAPITGIEILDQRYKTLKGIGLGSTFGELKKNYKIDEVISFAFGYDFLTGQDFEYEDENGTIAVNISEMNASIGIQKKHLLPNWDNFDGTIDVSKIPDNAPIYSFTITWSDLFNTDDDPNSGKVLEYFTTADEAYQRGNYSEAIQYYNKVLGICPEQPYAYLGIGNSYLYSENHSQATTYFNKVLDIDPHDSHIFWKLGVAFTNLKNYNQSISCYKRALEITPNYSGAYIGLGNVSFYLKDYNQTISYYNKAIEIDSEFSLAYHNLGLVYQALKDNSTANYYYRKAAEFDPNYTVTQNKLKQARAGNKEAQLWCRDNGYYW